MAFRTRGSGMAGFYSLGFVFSRGTHAAAVVSGEAASSRRCAPECGRRVIKESASDMFFHIKGLRSALLAKQRQPLEVKDPHLAAQPMGLKRGVSRQRVERPRIRKNAGRF